MEKLEIFDIKLENINFIKALWEKNRLYHEKSSEYFSDEYKFICFEEKMDKFKKINKEMLKISICKDIDVIIGYCISSIADGKGEVESIHVDESKRGIGIGKGLLDEHLQWMRGKNCKSIGVTVSQENLSTINFYKKAGFFPNTIYMQQLIK